MGTIQLSCDCGSVKGQLTEISPTTGNRIVCYCKDCQAFAEFLGKEAEILDPHGGSDIYQSPQAHIHITEGYEHIGRMRLSEKGLNRWYTTCCKSPIGNTMGAGSPFMGVLRYAMRGDVSALVTLMDMCFSMVLRANCPLRFGKLAFHGAKLRGSLVCW